MPKLKNPNETFFCWFLNTVHVSYLERQTCLDTTPYVVQLASQQWNSIFFLSSWFMTILGFMLCSQNFSLRYSVHHLALLSSHGTDDNNL